LTQAANPELFATSEWLATVSSLVLLWLTPLFTLVGFTDQALKKQCWFILEWALTLTVHPSRRSSYDTVKKTEKGGWSERQTLGGLNVQLLPRSALFLPLNCALEADR
ncbi:uncharacterized protein CCOS01_09787, partial [Colletotrichum costaricense]